MQLQTAMLTCNLMEEPGRLSRWTACLSLITTHSSLCERLGTSCFRQLHGWKRLSPGHRLDQLQLCAAAASIPGRMVIPIPRWCWLILSRPRLQPSHQQKLARIDGLPHTHKYNSQRLNRALRSLQLFLRKTRRVSTSTISY